MVGTEDRRQKREENFIMVVYKKKGHPAQAKSGLVTFRLEGPILTQKFQCMCLTSNSKVIFDLGGL
jgi:hypothetical protein